MEAGTGEAKTVIKRSFGFFPVTGIMPVVKRNLYFYQRLKKLNS